MVILDTTIESSVRSLFKMIQTWLYRVVGIRASKSGMSEMVAVAWEAYTDLIFVETLLMFMMALFSLANKPLTSNYSSGTWATDKRQKLFRSMKNCHQTNQFSCIAPSFRRTHMILSSLVVAEPTRSRFSMETLSSNHATESTTWVEHASPVISVIQVKPLQLAAVTASCVYLIFKRKDDLCKRQNGILLIYIWMYELDVPFYSSIYVIFISFCTEGICHPYACALVTRDSP